MNINSIVGTNNFTGGTAVQAQQVTGNTFSDILNDTINQVEQTAVEDKQGTLNLLAGQADNPSDILIQTEKADLALKLSLQIRNKVLDAYTEIMRMQI